MVKPIIWHIPAFNAFLKAIEYIQKDSLQNSQKVKNDILLKLHMVQQYPESFSPDKYRINNDRLLYRAFEIHKFRISYYIGGDEIRVVRFRSTRMIPKSY